MKRINVVQIVLRHRAAAAGYGRFLSALAICAIVLASGILLPDAAAQSELQRDPGYVDISRMSGWFDGDPTIEVNVKGALLNMIAEASRFEDPDLATLLHRLKAIQVRAYELDRADFGRASGKLKDLGKSLESDGWESVVRARQDDEHVEMFVRTRGNRIAGMIVLSLDQSDREAIMVNIVGEIDPDEIGRIGRRFNFGILSNDY